MASTTLLREVSHQLTASVGEDRGGCVPRDPLARRASFGVERTDHHSEATLSPLPAGDPDATAAVLLASLTYYPILNALIGHPPGDIDADRFTEAWVQHAAATLGN